MGPPRARSLFRRTVESGGSFSPVLSGTAGGDAWQDADAPETSGEEWAAALGANDAGSLRALSAAGVKSVSAPDWADNEGGFGAAQPIVDGAILPEGP